MGAHDTTRLEILAKFRDVGEDLGEVSRILEEYDMLRERGLTDYMTVSLEEYVELELERGQDPGPDRLEDLVDVPQHFRDAARADQVARDCAARAEGERLRREHAARSPFRAPIEEGE